MITFDEIIKQKEESYAYYLGTQAYPGTSCPFTGKAAEDWQSGWDDAEYLDKMLNGETK
jgi:hypothetical protein